MTLEEISRSASYSTKQTAFYLGFSESYVRRLIHGGRIKATKPGGGQWRIVGAEILRVRESMAAEGRVPSTNGDRAADEILVSQEAADKIFNNTPAPGADISPPDQSVEQDGDGGSLYEQMQRRYSA